MRRGLGVLLLALLAWFLLWDATSSVLIARDVAKGREMGCYTAIELLMGVTKPGPIRLIELVMGVATIVYIAYLLFFRFRRRPKPSG